MTPPKSRSGSQHIGVIARVTVILVTVILELAVRPHHRMVLPGIFCHPDSEALSIGASAQDRLSGIRALVA